jgi:hypothetical protein
MPESGLAGSIGFQASIPNDKAWPESRAQERIGAEIPCLFFFACFFLEQNKGGDIQEERG